MKKIAFVIGALALAAPAQAHWQYTTWGMTPEQVVAASAGAAELGSGEISAQGDAKKGAIGRYSAGDYQFSVSFWFNSTGLSTVSLTMRNDVQCLGLQRDLLAKYADPIEQSGGAVQRRMWADRAANNRVVLISTGSFCELQYAPLVSRSGSGL